MIYKNKIPLSYIFNELKTPLFFVSLIAIFTAVLPFFFSSFLSNIPISIATTLGVAISILLSYMINQSYERWWEARKIWGEIVNDSRTLVLQLQMYVDEGNQEIQNISYRQVCWGYYLGQALRKETSSKIPKRFLSEDDIKLVNDHKHKPLCLLSLQNMNIRELHKMGKIDKFSQIKIEETLASLTASMGKCERIKNTVFPAIYRYGLHTTIYLFVIFLSLSVAFELQHFMLQFFILLIVSTVFFFLEKAAFRMQDPFENIPTDTPITSIAETIESNILQLLGEDASSVTINSANKFYVL
ncbi:bestrophin family protein [Fulvivirga sediminis]|uniref:Bestrophin n=1 Tax=Fulvivirga sediminis TaxID=2803949 RepID=A0A937F2J7_9BACT|nr:bestrophin family ion channel [Fulvivirga sediminis]MBL3655127.1 hypothetical protein [Fulvivirga sediminis]